MNSSVKKLTEAAIFSSAFIIITMVALSTGIGYGLYLDFGVPIIFALIYFRCELKYTFMCGISSILLILFVMGNFAAAILVSQSFLLGLLCGYLICKSSQIFDDLYVGAILGVIFMVLVDIYARNIIGYSFMEEFQEYVEYMSTIPQFAYVNFHLVYYLCVAIFPLGMVFSVYFISIICGKRLRILNSNGQRKYFMMRSMRNYGSFMCLKKERFYISIVYIILVNILQTINVHINDVYLNTIITCTQYLAYYFVFRDTHVLIGNYINSKFKSQSLNFVYLLITLILLCNMFKITVLFFIIISMYLDKRYDAREKQSYIVENHTNKLMEIYKV